MYLIYCQQIRRQSRKVKQMVKMASSQSHSANSSDQSASFISYNMLGFNQGESLLKWFCEDDDLNIDCILLQEHWLTPANLYKMKTFSPNYSFYGISAMELAVSNSVLRGRPFGEAGIFVKKYALQK